MDNAVAVRVIQAAAGLGDDLNRLLDIEVPPVAEKLGARMAGDVLHHDEVLVVTFVKPEIENLDDVGMHQPGGGQRLAAKP